MQGSYFLISHEWNCQNKINEYLSSHFVAKWSNHQSWIISAKYEFSVALILINVAEVHCVQGYLWITGKINVLVINPIMCHCPFHIFLFHVIIFLINISLYSNLLISINFLNQFFIWLCVIWISNFIISKMK